VLTDQPGDKSWPITGASYILIHKDQTDAAKAEAMLKFFDWCLKNGADLAIDLHYVPMPGKVSSLIKTLWSKEMTAGGKLVWK
jgi:phosphate transport system substrate-binding protein